MPHAWEFAIFIHIVAVAGLFGAATTDIVLLSMMRRAKTVQELRMWSAAAETIERVFPVPVVLLLLSGGYLVDKLNLSFSDGWIGWSALALLATVPIGYFVNARRVMAIGSAAKSAPDGPLPAPLAGQAADPVLFGAAHAMALGAVGIIWNMTTKPNGFEAFIIIVLGYAIGAASAYPMIARQQAILKS